MSPRRPAKHTAIKVTPAPKPPSAPPVLPPREDIAGEPEPEPTPKPPGPAPAEPFREDDLARAVAKSIKSQDDIDAAAKAFVGWMDWTDADAAEVKEHRPDWFKPKGAAGNRTPALVADKLTGLWEAAGSTSRSAMTTWRGKLALHADDGTPPPEHLTAEWSEYAKRLTAWAKRKREHAAATQAEASNAEGGGVRTETHRIDGASMAALYPNPENVLWWPTRNTVYDFDARTGLWTEDQQDARVQARLSAVARKATVTVEKPDGTAVLPVHVDKHTIANGVHEVKLERQHANPPWDADPDLCGTPDGVFDLRTGNVRPGERDEFVMGRLGATPAEGATPVWDAFMDFAFPDADERHFVLCVLASLLGGVHVESVFMFRGVSRSGKTKLVEFMMKLAGSYGGTFPRGTVTREPGEYPPGHRAWMIPLRHARFAVAPEIKKRHYVQAADLNDWSDGGFVTADRKGGAEETWQSFVKPVLYGNEDPQMDVNSGITERLIRIEMDRVKPKHERDTRLDAKLWNEAPGVLWTLGRTYAARIDEQHFLPDVPPRFREATEEYLASADDKLRFIRDTLTLTGDMEDRIASADMFDAVTKWCAREDVKPPANAMAATKWIKHRLQDATPRPHLHQGGTFRGWLGVKLTGEAAGA